MPWVNYGTNTICDMILLKISGKSEQQIEEIALLLLKEKLGIDINIERHLERLELEHDRLVTERVCLLTAKTKALLFPAIDKLLQEKYANEIPEIYSIPIVHMDWEQSSQLVRDIKEV